jgi:hypothetical protein
LGKNYKAKLFDVLNFCQREDEKKIETEIENDISFLCYYLVPGVDSMIENC